MEWKEGSCHCKSVQFRVRDPFEKITRCDCSICQRKGFLHIIVEKENFELKSGEDSLVSYQFNTKTANHLFCKNCGISSFYIPRSHPDGYSVNARCVDDLDIPKLEINEFQGSDWEANIDQLKD